MPDICMCGGVGCEQKGTCYRYTAEAHPYRQSYFAGAPMTSPTECVYFVLDNRTEKEKNVSRNDV